MTETQDRVERLNAISPPSRLLLNWVNKSSIVLFLTLFFFNSHSNGPVCLFLPLTLSLFTLTMKLTAINVLSFASLPAFVLAHADPYNPFRHHNRQAVAVAASSSSSSSSSPPSSPSSPSSPASAAPVSGITLSTSLFPTPTATPSFTIESTNPTAYPLSEIVVNAPSAPTIALPSPSAPGSTPSDIPNAPGLPDSMHLTLFSDEKD